MLTDKQQQIISDLKKEFTKINTPAPTSSGGLINRAAIDKKFEDTRKRKAEIEAINASTVRMIREMMDRDVDRLNKDLIPMGIYVTIKGGGTYSQQIFFGTYNVTAYFSATYYANSVYENLPDGSGINVYKGFEYIGWHGNTYKNIEELCKDKDFIGRIEGIYSQVLKDKQ